jgi:hypothetical protein
MVVRAQNYLSNKAHQLRGNEDASELEVSLTRDETLSNQLEFIDYLMSKIVLKYDQSVDGQLTLQIVQAATVSLAQYVQTADQDLASCATACIWLQVLNKTKPHRKLIDVVFDVLEMHKNNSKYFLTQVGAVMEGTTRQLKRASNLYTEILDLLVSFLVSYLTSTPSVDLSQRLFELLYTDSQFTLSEQLHVLKQMNASFYKIKPI